MEETWPELIELSLSIKRRLHSVLSSSITFQCIDLKLGSFSPVAFQFILKQLFPMFKGYVSKLQKQPSVKCISSQSQ